MKKLLFTAVILAAAAPAGQTANAVNYNTIH